MHRKSQIALGNICNGGGASINNSPTKINFTVNIIIDNKAKDDDLSIVGKVLTALGLKNDRRKIATIEIPAHAIDYDVQRQLLRHLANR